MRLGKVIRSNNHCDYIVQVDDPLEVKSPPSPEDYGFGSFVRLEDEKRHWAVGVVYNTQLFNPMVSSIGPRLSSDPNPIFSPDLQADIRILLSVVLIGSLVSPQDPARNGRPEVFGLQGIPRVVVPVSTPVHRMSQTEIYRFHLNPTGNSQFTYYGLLLNCGGSFADHLLHQVLNEISPLFEGPQKRALELLSKELSWKMTMGAMR